MNDAGVVASPAFRKLLPSDATRLAGHLARMTPEERMLRFMGAVSDEAVREHCLGLNWFRTVVIGFFDAGVLRGAGELQVVDSTFPILCEIAVTVETGWQGQGVGTELVRRARLVARNRASRGLLLTCLSDNHRMQHIARSFGARVDATPGQSDAEIPTPGPTFATLFEEASSDSLGLMSRAWEHIAAMNAQQRK